MTRPINIVQITTHDSGRHFGCYGHSTVQTPAIDAVAEGGVRLANMFTTSPICSPARCSLLTGVYPQQHGMMDLPARGWRLADPGQHLAHRLRAVGYHTVLAGLQHEAPPSESRALGYDAVARDSTAERGHRTAAEVAQAAAAVISERSRSDAPFYLNVGLFETHTPWSFGGASPDDSLGVEVPGYLVDEPGNREQLAAFQGAIRRADDAVGVISRALDHAGIANDTLLVFTTDHGIEMPRAKWDLADPGIEVAMVMRCPSAGIVGGRVVNALTSAIDFVPTVAELTKCTAEDVEGVGLRSVLTGATTDEVHDEIFGMFHLRNTRGVRTREHKLIRWFGDIGYYPKPVAWPNVLQRSVSGPVLLFDLIADRWEFANLADDPGHSDLLAELDDRLWRWMEHVDDPLLRGPVVTPTYRDAMDDYSDWRRRQ